MEGEKERNTRRERETIKRDRRWKIAFIPGEYARVVYIVVVVVVESEARHADGKQRFSTQITIGLEKRAVGKTRLYFTGCESEFPL